MIKLILLHLFRMYTFSYFSYMALQNPILLVDHNTPLRVLEQDCLSLWKAEAICNNNDILQE